MEQQQTNSNSINEIIIAAAKGWQCLRDNATRLEHKANAVVEDIKVGGQEAGASEEEIASDIWTTHIVLMARFLKEAQTALMNGLREGAAQEPCYDPNCLVHGRPTDPLQIN